MSLKKGHVLLAVLAAILAAVAGAAIKIAADPAAAANATAFSGRATGISGTVLGITVGPIVDATIPAEGGSAHGCLTAYPGGKNCVIPTEVVGDQTNGAVRAEVLSSRVVGQGNKSRASFSLVDFSVDVCKLLNLGATCTLSPLTAEVLNAQATAVCQQGLAAVSGDSVPLTLQGLPAGVEPVYEEVRDALGNLIATRYKIELGVATIYLNEQKITGTPSGHYQIEVNAIRIESAATNTNLVIGHVEADITCGTAAGACPDAKITGGGWYEWPPLSGNKVHFALSARQNDPTWGHLMYQDRNAPLGTLKFHGKPDFAVLVGSGNAIAATDRSSFLDVSVGEGAAVVSGTNKQPFTYNGVSYAAGTARFVAVAIDNGEGKSAPGDVVGVVIFGLNDAKIYAANADGSAGVLTTLLGEKLGGGNVQFHGCKGNK